MSAVVQKLFATWWAICLGGTLVNYMYHPDKHVYWFAIIAYFILFTLTMFEIKMKQSVFIWFYRRHKARKAEEEYRWTR